MALKRVPCNAWWKETSAHFHRRTGIGLPMAVMRMLLGGPFEMDVVTVRTGGR